MQPEPIQLGESVGEPVGEPLGESAESLLLVRAPAVTDLPYIMSLWGRQLEGTPMGKAGGEHMRDVLHRWMRGVLARTSTTALLACAREARSTILGFAVYQNKSVDTAGFDREGVLHCVFVRPEMRGCGIAKRLLKHHVGKACSLNAWKGLKYTPERLWR